jgi:hypothetical protein
MGGEDGDGEDAGESTLGTIITVTSPHRLGPGPARPPAARSPKDKEAAAPGRTRADHMVAGRLADKSYRVIHVTDGDAIAQGLCGRTCAPPGLMAAVV